MSSFSGRTANNSSAFFSLYFHYFHFIRLSVINSIDFPGNPLALDHVMPINNSGDLPHCVTVKDAAKAVAAQALSVANPLLNFVPQFNKMQQENMIAANPFRAYDQAPWTHLWLKKQIFDDNARDNTRMVRMEHGTMFDNISEDVVFSYYVNGQKAEESHFLSGII
ncbi:MAG: hypothetical protein GXY05_13875, partial [Clostridiales bacterium]|nr:hypothetical protein [Clostridiales bacterium]